MNTLASISGLYKSVDSNKVKKIYFFHSQHFRDRRNEAWASCRVKSWFGAFKLLKLVPVTVCNGLSHDGDELLGIKPRAVHGKGLLKMNTS